MTTLVLIVLPSHIVSHAPAAGRPARGAFSLIELILAMGLGTIILLLTITAVRSSAQAVSHIQRNATENALLRSGWFIALDDADYWNSHANPEYPYLKGPLSDEVAPAGDRNNPWDKRPFRRVTWTPATVPTQLLPHDIASWYRNGPLPGPMPRVRVPPSWNLLLFMVSGDDPTTNVDQDARKFLIPAGWAPWHIHGDYSMISNVTDAGTRPAVQWDVFGELGHIGVFTYLPPGTPNLILRPSTNRSTANIGNRATWYDWGEVPWSLAVPAPGDAFSPTSVPVPSATIVANHQRYHYMLGLPGSPKVNRVTLTSNMDEEVEAKYSNLSSTANKFWLTDLELTSGGASFLNGVMMGNRALLSANGTDFDTNTLIDGVYLDPWRALEDADLNRGNQSQASLSLMYSRFASRTFHLPQSPTDALAPDLSRRPPGSPTLATTMFRVRHQAGDRAWMSVVVQNPDTGTRLELPFSVLSTTLRGARQHWGWKTSVDRSDLKPMGDVHVP